ncbi:alpha/beta hydrolase fold domain-containing protein [Sphingomonas abaci]|uniref:Acetyl esterase/lipase n=1 Tax=Sphingomonas abaci TaxID=237611 RepID=A0A7W7EW84_9SPHN|nr:alpha/beta hydrolase [Sphingomonas abaci]MBB4616308.1 acetyl esterase/lipase [Sphingomonas abaci]
MKRGLALLAAAAVIPLAGLLARGWSRSPGASLPMRSAALIVKARGNRLADPERFRAAILARSYPTVPNLPAAMHTRFNVREEEVAGRRTVMVAPRADASRWVILYNHGGAYVNELVEPHWAIVQALVEATGATVVVPIYPLSPESDNRAAFPYLMAVYRHILETTDAKHVVLAGDSAGGGLALGEAIEFRRLGLPTPGRIILFSPWLDLTLADRAARDVEKHDVMLGIDALRLCGQWWAGGDDPKSPRLSPLYADLAGMPPIDIYQGTADLLVVDVRSFVSKAREAGVLGDYGEYPDAFHVFVGATFTPEARDVFKRIGQTLI